MWNEPENQFITGNYVNVTKNKSPHLFQQPVSRTQVRPEIAVLILVLVGSDTIQVALEGFQVVELVKKPVDLWYANLLPEENLQTFDSVAHVKLGIQKILLRNRL
jgi:hypothetical protein